jgi:hypothetical protein
MTHGSRCLTADAWHERSPDERLQRLKASHWVPQDAPLEFAQAVMEFLGTE